jgi:hypothetical protein
VVGELAIEVDVDGARDVPCAERLAPVGLGERPAHVEHHGAFTRRESCGEFVCGDEDRHGSILPRPAVKPLADAAWRNVSSCLSK